jgi:hypothetical protein
MLRLKLLQRPACANLMTELEHTLWLLDSGSRAFVVAFSGLELSWGWDGEEETCQAGKTLVFQGTQSLAREMS